jgi:hypothetical protein
LQGLRIILLALEIVNRHKHLLVLCCI